MAVRCRASKAFERNRGRRSTRRVARCDEIRNGMQALARLHG
ncbi:hypothetical protein C7S13_4082 [Burkholderia cepacia]|nr:hypothetical protein [Burkholderia cepacia]